MADHEYRWLLAHPAQRSAALQRRPVHRMRRHRPRPRPDRPAHRSLQRRLALRRAGHLRHPAGARPRCPRAPQARRPLHPARLCRAPRAADRDRTAARRMARSAGRRARLGAGRQTQGGGGRGTGLPPPPVHRAGTRPGLRQRQLPVCDARAHEAPRRRSAQPPSRPGPVARPAAARRRHRRPAPVSRPRDQPPRRPHRRNGAVDRLPAMALPHPRQRPAAAARAA